MMRPPTIDEVVQDPRRAKSLPEDVLTALLARCGEAQGIITAALIMAGAKTVRSSRAEVDLIDKMLTVKEAAEILREPARWFYRNAQKHSFIRRMSRKKLLVSEKGLRQWLASRS